MHYLRQTLPSGTKTYPPHRRRWCSRCSNFLNTVCARETRVSERERFAAIMYTNVYMCNTTHRFASHMFTAPCSTAIFTFFHRALLRFEIKIVERLMIIERRRKNIFILACTANFLFKFYIFFRIYLMSISVNILCQYLISMPYKFLRPIEYERLIAMIRSQKILR